MDSEYKVSKKAFKVSFVTIAMNRLEHIKKTLPENLVHNNSDCTEFIVLDYNSSDGLEEWVLQNLSSYILSGKLRFYRTDKPKYFHGSHSRNLAFPLAKGDLICNVDADNFTGSNFDMYLIEQFSLYDYGVMFANLNSDAMGRIAVRKDLFLRVRGYDESISGYGFEDVDLVSRLSNISKKGVITNKSFLNSIKHSDVKRLGNEFTYNLVESVHIKKCGCTSSIILYIFKNQTVSVLKCEDAWNSRSSSIENYYLVKPEFQYEVTIEKATAVDLHDLLKLSNCVFEEFKKVEDEALKVETLMFLSQIMNREIYINNRLDKTRIINPMGFGLDI